MDVCRKLGISEAAFYRWKERYGWLMPSEVRKLKREGVIKLGIG